MAVVVASLGCSAQARSSRDKPRPPVLRTCVVHRFPPVTRYALARWSAHPVPIALGEMRQLCEINQSHGVGDHEFVGETGRISVTGGAARDSEPLPTTSVVPGVPMGALKNRVVTELVTPIRYPRFDLSPSVVIRRRPQRPHPSGSAC